ncbi:MAG TPA: LuxR C-terminal-related transcriptional regulator, partial [Solirubrobacteraceae bacterium]|nr:LuxR C-terminal-related transcriptional regulator [Solirubrobacteraceae bacterium]
ETLSRGAPALAARFLRRALREPPPMPWRPGLLLAAGQAEARAGDARAVAHLREALEHAPDDATQARAALELIQLLGRSGELSAGADLALRVIDRLDPRDDLRLRLEAELLNLALLDRGLRPLGLERLAQLEPAVLGNAPGACMLLAVLASDAAARGESRAEAISLAERALAGGWLLESVFLHVHAASALILSGRYAQSIAVCDDFIAHARARGDLPGLALAHAFRASGHWHAGSLDQALAESELATGLAPPAVAAVASSFALTFRIEALVLRGDIEQARMTLPAATGPADQLPSALLLSARGRLRLAEGRTLEALEDMRAVGGLLDRWQAPNSAFAPWRAEAALALHSMGDLGGARKLIEDELHSAGRWGDPWLLGQAMRAQALVGAVARRIPVLDDAVEVLRPSEARLELARALAELGIAEGEAGRRRVAREHLREATEIAEECAAPAVAQRARQALIAAGGRPRRSAATGPLALTPTEDRIARLAAEGMSNRRIAQSLFITEKTVETHLANAYRKLGIRVRGELAAALTA